METDKQAFAIMPALASRLARSRFPMKYRVYDTLLRTGLLKSHLNFHIGGIRLSAPADEWLFWKIRDAANYQVRRLALLCAFINERLGDFDMVDLGADIGIVSRVVAARCQGLKSVVAVEPNPRAFRYLQANLQRLPVPAATLNIAVSDVSGQGTLEFDSTRTSDHTGYVTAGTAGMTKIEPVDHFYRRMADDIVMKIDVEGHEQATFRGAAEALRQSRRVVVFVEMHRAVIDRTGISPEMIFAAAEAHRPCVWFLAEPGLPPIDRSRPFFEQFPVEQHDVIGLMHEDGASPGQ